MAKWIGSPNYGVGRGGNSIEMIVCHWIVGNVAAADTVFAKVSSETSAHYAVGDGVVHQYVQEGNTAWHSNNFNINQKSIGIEHQGGPGNPISEATYETSANLIADISRRYGRQLPLRPHRDFTGTACPGTLDLNKLNNMVTNKLKGNKDMIGPKDRDILRIINSEVKGWPFLPTHTGQFDAREIAAWTGHDYEKLISEAWVEGETFRNMRNQKLADYDKLAAQVSELSKNPTKADLQAITDKFSASQVKTAELEKKLAEGAGNSPDDIVISRTAWAKAFDAIKSFFKKG